MEPKKIERIFWEAAQLTSTGERDAYLDRACAEDLELRCRVEELLLARSKAEQFLESPAISLTATTDERPISEGPGTAIGPYKLLEQIGEGGFGVVFLAEQQRPVRRKVALKVLKPGMDTRQVIARFEVERQALALMDHPNIARVFDGGETASGRPYFVMELVKGVPLADYGDQGQHTTRDRLEVFLDLCQAVQHAHQKGIIHRDLKPSNVLVTLRDGKPVVKVIDFGIAKATGQQLTDKTLFTHGTHLVGTPLYMSPEQAALGGQDVDTRSDVYSLGVLLYELLTGTTPFTRERFQEAGYDEICRIIREEEPPKPSTRLSTLGEAATVLATQRKSDPRRLRQLLRGELDWIVMKCLEKDRNRRYESASALARDVERYLHDEPVQACPPSALYRFGKFARRHKRALVTGVLLGVMLLAAVGAVAGSLGWVARTRAARLVVAEENVKQALDDATGLQGQAKWPEALEAMKRAEGFLPTLGSEQLRARVQEKRKDLEMVLRLEEARLPRAVGGVEGDADSAWADASCAKAFREYGIDVESLDPPEAAERIRARSIRLELAVALDTWADSRKSSRKADDTSWKRIVAVARAADPDTWRNQVRDALEHGDRQTLNTLAAAAKVSDLPVQSLSLLVSKGHLDIELERSLLRQAQREHPDDFWINFQLAWGFDFPPAPPQHFDEAIRFYTAALAIRPRNVPTRVFLASALRHHGKPEEAIAAYRKAIELKPDYVAAYCGLHQVLQEQGKWDEAALWYRKFIEVKPDSVWAHNNLAWLLATCPDPKFHDGEQALQHARRAVELAPRDGNAWNTLGVACYRAGHYQESKQALEKSMELLGGRFEGFNTFFLAMAHWQLGDAAGARQCYQQAVGWVEKNRLVLEKAPGDLAELRRFRAEAAALLGTQGEATAPGR
jgi:serine/threonine protein kinase/Flp pilus assembly protein TadD